MEIGAPPEQVFPYLVGSDERLQWMGLLVESEPLGERRFRLQRDLHDSAQQRLLELLLPGDSASGRHAGQLMDHRHDRTRGSPAVEPGSTNYAGQGIHDDRVETSEVEAGAE